MKKITFTNKLIIIAVSTFTTYFSLYLMTKMCINIIPQFATYAGIPFALITIAVTINAIKIVKDKQEVLA